MTLIEGLWPDYRVIAELERRVAVAMDETERARAENVRLREQLAAYEAQWGALYARRSSGL